MEKICIICKETKQGCFVNLKLYLLAEERLSRSFSGCGREPWVPSTCVGDLRQLLRVPLRSQGHCGFGRGLSLLNWVWCNWRGPHLVCRQEPQGSSPFLTRVAEYLQSMDKRVTPRLLWRNGSPLSLRVVHGVTGLLLSCVWNLWVFPVHNSVHGLRLIFQPIQGAGGDAALEWQGDQGDKNQQRALIVENKGYQQSQFSFCESSKCHCMYGFSKNISRGIPSR